MYPRYRPYHLVGIKLAMGSIAELLSVDPNNDGLWMAWDDLLAMKRIVDREIEVA